MARKKKLPTKPRFEFTPEERQAILILRLIVKPEPEKEATFVNDLYKRSKKKYKKRVALYWKGITEGQRRYLWGLFFKYRYRVIRFIEREGGDRTSYAKTFRLIDISEERKHNENLRALALYYQAKGERESAV